MQDKRLTFGAYAKVKDGKSIRPLEIARMLVLLNLLTEFSVK